MQNRSNLLIAYSLALHRALKKLTILTSNVYGLDKTFRIIQYTCQLLSIYTPPPSSSRLSYIALKTLSPISDARFTIRLVSIIHLLASMPLSSFFLFQKLKRDEVWSRFKETTSWFSLVMYSITEFVYFCGHHDILKLKSQRILQFSQLSCQAWALWIVFQLLPASSSLSTPSKSKLNSSKSWLEWIMYMCDLGLALHWSRSKPLLPSPTWVAWLGWVGGIASFRESWKKISLD